MIQQLRSDVLTFLGEKPDATLAEVIDYVQRLYRVEDAEMFSGWLDTQGIYVGRGVRKVKSRRW